MANPQKEHGHLRIANDVWDALCRIRIPGEIRQILDVIIRQTWGYGKKATMITLDQFAEKTGLKKSNIVRAVKKLVQMNLIIRYDNGTYAFQKDFDRWRPLSKVITLSELIKPVIRTDNLPLSELITPTLSKDIIKDNIKNKYKHLDFVYLTNEQYEKLQKRFGEALPGKIEDLNNYIGSKGKKYHSHYHTILAWEKKNGKASTVQGNNSRNKPENRIEPEPGKYDGI